MSNEGTLSIPANGTTENNDLTSTILKEVQGDVVIGLPKNKEEFCFFTILDLLEFINNLSRLEVSNGEAVLKKKVEIRSTPKGRLVKAGFINIAFSGKGLEMLGCSQEDLLKLDNPDDRNFLTSLEVGAGIQGPGDPQFPCFKDGQLASAKALGDSGRNINGKFDPDWEIALKQEIHGIILIAADSWETARERENHIDEVLGGSIRKIYSLKGAVRPAPYRGHEHFGWLDDISNPAVKGVGIDGKGTFLPGQTQVDPGVFVCGMDGDSNGRPDWAKGGSILVFRKLKQNVPEFHKYLADTAHKVLGDSSAEGAHKLGAHLVGRWKSGAPLQLTPEKDDEKLGKDKDRNNKFNFPQGKSDQGQALCPFASHIRKTNPRSDLPQRAVEERSIRRAGITYGPEVTASEEKDKITEHDRGLAFVCYQSNLAKGFEFMQRTWANNPDFPEKGKIKPGLDPLIGQNKTSEDGSRGRDTWGTEHGPKIRGLPEFVISRGGGYYFSPSISVLKDASLFSASV